MLVRAAIVSGEVDLIVATLTSVAALAAVPSPAGHDSPGLLISPALCTMVGQAVDPPGGMVLTWQGASYKRRWWVLRRARPSRSADFADSFAFVMCWFCRGIGESAAAAITIASSEDQTATLMPKFRDKGCRVTCLSVFANHAAAVDW